MDWASVPVLDTAIWPLFFCWVGLYAVGRWLGRGA